MKVSLLKRTFPIRQNVLELKTPQSQACVIFCLKECLSFHGSIFNVGFKGELFEECKAKWGLWQKSVSVSALQALFLTRCPPIRFPSKRPRGRHKRSIFHSWFEVDNDCFHRFSASRHPFFLLLPHSSCSVPVVNSDSQNADMIKAKHFLILIKLSAKWLC